MKIRNLKVCSCTVAYNDIASMSERIVRIHQDEDVCEECRGLLQIFGAVKTKRLLFEYMAEVKELRTRLSELHGAVPRLPPRPPEGGGLPRYGVRWCGNSQPITVPMYDGYWTPYHLAEKIIQSIKGGKVKEPQIESLCDVCKEEERIEGEGWCFNCMSEFYESEDSKE